LSPDTKKFSVNGVPQMSEITRILTAIHQGNWQAREQLWTLVYDELRRLAAQKMAREAPGHTLQATALVHEVWLRLAGSGSDQWHSRAHFFGAAAEAMRRVLIERARRRAAAKRGSGAAHSDLDAIEVPSPIVIEAELLEMDEALAKLAETWPRKAELVKLRYFVGLTFEEAAAALGIAVPTAKEWWAHARAWLAVEIGHQRQQ
jgi:RNA polymerase sigma factor (TIGR02999 family)